MENMMLTNVFCYIFALYCVVLILLNGDSGLYISMIYKCFFSVYKKQDILRYYTKWKKKNI